MREKIEVVKELISIADENDLAELSIDFKGLKIDIKKEKYTSPTTAIVQTPAAAPAAVAEGGQAAPTEPEIPENAVAVKSPLSGVFYRAPKPGAPPFCNVGETVEAGQTLCIVEAMKLMNEIAAEVRGKVVKICKENAEVAGEGDVLFHIVPEE